MSSATPDFDKLKPAKTGVTSDFDLGVGRRINDCAIKFDGFVKIDNDGSLSYVDGYIAVVDRAYTIQYASADRALPRSACAHPRAGAPASRHSA